MAKELSISKKLNISKSQQNLMLAVLGAAVTLGVSAVLAIYFVKVIGFNATVISEKEAAVESYSDLIRDVGVCEKPGSRVYSEAELKSCTPDDVAVSSVAGSLRYQVLVDMAQDKNLESVARGSLTQCYSTTTNQKHSYAYWNDKIENAINDDLRAYYMQMLGLCSALRVIPDALPANQNAPALMASLDKIFVVSNWSPESLSPGGTITTDISGLNAIELNLSVEADDEKTMTVLGNIEKSIREFNINSATIEWSGSKLLLEAKAVAYYVDKQGLIEETETVKGDGTITKGSDETMGVEY